MVKRIYFPAILVGLALLGILACSRSDSLTYYVSPMGDDSWSGTVSSADQAGTNGPYRTIGKAASLMKAGDRCILQAGTYREVLKPASSGTREHPMVFEAAPGEKVVISCCDILPGKWEQVSAEIYSLILDSVPETPALFSGPVALTTARWPNAGEDPLRPVYAAVVSGNHVSLTGKDIPKEFRLESCLLSGFFGKEWALQNFQVTSYDPHTGTIHFPEAPRRQNYYEPPEGWDRKYAPRDGNRFYLTGGLELLDHPREYFLDRDSRELFIFLPEGRSLEQMDIESKSREHGVDLSGCSWVQVRNVEVFGGGILSNEETSHCLLDGLRASHVDPGIRITGRHNEVMNSELAYCQRAIVNLSGDSNRLVNNHIHDGNFSGSWDQLVSVNGRGHLLSHNTVSRAGGGCISPGGTHNVFQYNDVSVAGLVRHDIGGFYIANHSGNGNVIHHNRVHDIYGIGIYLDNSSSHYTVHHNVVWNCGWEFVTEKPPAKHVDISAYDAIRLNTPSNFNLVFHNTCYNEDGGIGYWGRNFIQDMYGDMIANNIFTGPNRYTESAVFCQNVEKDTDPDFRDPDALDFNLQEGSAAIDCGLAIPGINDDFEGEGPDCGALEKGREPWSAGHDFENPPQLSIPAARPVHMNRLVNGGFEDAYADWDASAEEGIQHVRENSWGLEDAGTRMQNGAVRISSEASLSQQLEVLEAGTYLLSGWIYQDDVVESARISLKEGDSELLSLTSPLEGWSFVNAEFEAAGGEDQRIITLSVQSGEGRVHFDDIGLIRVMECKE